MKKLGAIFLSVFGGVGLVLLILGLVFWGSQTSFRASAVKTTATIVSIGGGGRYSSVTVAFEAGGETYTGQLGYYSSFMRVGDSVSVYYNPDNPMDFKADTWLLPILFTSLGAFFLLLGLVFFFAFGGAARGGKRLTETGYRINAKIVRVDWQVYINVNGRHPWRIFCEGYDAESGGQRQFKSEYLWEDPSYVLEEKQIKTLPVYLDSRKRKRYYVDVSALTI